MRKCVSLRLFEGKGEGKGILAILAHEGYACRRTHASQTGLVLVRSIPQLVRDLGNRSCENGFNYNEIGTSSDIYELVQSFLV